MCLNSFTTILNPLNSVYKNSEDVEIVNSNPRHWLFIFCLVYVNIVSTRWSPNQSSDDEWIDKLTGNAIAICNNCHQGSLKSFKKLLVRVFVKHFSLYFLLKVSVLLLKINSCTFKINISQSWMWQSKLNSSFPVVCYITATTLGGSNSLKSGHKA